MGNIPFVAKTESPVHKLTPRRNIDLQGPHVIAPRPGANEWWSGDASIYPHLRAGEPHPYIVTRPNALSKAQCQALIDCFERNREDHSGKTGSEYWDGRHIWQSSLPVDKELDAIRLLQQLRYLAQALITQFFLPDQPLYSDSAQLVQWLPGMELTCHVDNLEPDGRANASPYRTHSSILYLNDEYEGGETFFPGHGVRLKPEPGLLVVFGAGHDYVHGVTKVLSGKRYTYAGWFSHNPVHEDPGAMSVY